MSRKILVVDDSASMRQMVSFTLKDAGYEVVEAADGRIALEKLADSDDPFDMVITDLNMPNVSGLSLIQAIRAGTSHKFVPIIMLTTESGDAKKKEARHAGATGWIVKPFRPDQLISVVKRVLVDK